MQADEPGLDRPPSRVVITVHGIRTFGRWQSRLRALILRADPTVRVVNYNFGYFSMLAFWFPPTRWLVTRRFRQDLMAEANVPPGTTITIVGHSFGTHLIGWGLLGCNDKDRPRINTIILAGSVLRPGFPWRDLLDRRFVGRLINDCGVNDWVLVLNQLAVLFTGMAGRVGFSGMTTERFVNRFFRGGHALYFRVNGQDDDRFMEAYWLPLLMGTGAVDDVDQRPTPTVWSGILQTILQNAEPLKLLLFTSLFFWPACQYRRLYVESEERRAVAESQQLAARSRASRQSDLAELLAVEATRGSISDQRLTWLDAALTTARLRPKLFADTAEARGSLLSAIGTMPYLKTQLYPPAVGSRVVAVSTDGSLVASGVGDEGFAVWNLHSGSRIGPLRGTSSRVLATAFLPSGRDVVTGEASGAVSVWRLDGTPTDDRPRTLPGMVLALAVSDRLIAAGGTSNEVLIWEPSNEVRLPLPPEAGPILSLAFSRSGDLLAAGGENQLVLWERRDTWRMKLTIVGEYKASNIAFSPTENDWIAAVDSRGLPIVWRADGHHLRANVGEERPSEAHSVSFSRDGARLASASADGEIAIWNIGADLRLIQRFRVPSDRVDGLVFGQDSQLVSIGPSYPLLVWDLEGSKAPVKEARSLGLSPVMADERGQTILAQVGSRVVISEASTGLRPPCDFDSQEARPVGLSADGRRVATDLADGVAIWQREPLRLETILPFRGSGGSVHSAAFDHRGRAVAIADGGDEPDSVVIWDLEASTPTCYPFADIGQSPLATTEMAFSPNDELLAIRQLNSIQVFDVRTCTCRRQEYSFSPSERDIGDIKFSVSGRLLAATARQGVIVWDTATAKRLGTLMQATGPVVSFAFHPSETSLVSLSPTDLTLWDLSAMKEMGHVELARNRYRFVRTTDERTISLVGFGHTATMNLDVASWRQLACDRANRNLTTEEWRALVSPNGPRQKTCPSLPWPEE